jgi:hypothetical protein
MNYYSAMVEPVIPLGGFNTSGYGHESALGGSDDSLERQSTSLGPDLASANGEAL